MANSRAYNRGLKDAKQGVSDNPFIPGTKEYWEYATAQADYDTRN